MRVVVTSISNVCFTHSLPSLLSPHLAPSLCFLDVPWAMEKKGTNSLPEHLFLPKTPIHRIPKKDIPRVIFF